MAWFYMISLCVIAPVIEHNVFIYEKPNYLVTLSDYLCA